MAGTKNCRDSLLNAHLYLILQKVAGIFALILGIIALTPLPIIIGFWGNPPDAILLYSGRDLFIMIFPSLAIIFGCAGAKIAKTNSRTLSIFGILYGIAGFPLQFYLWPQVLMTFWDWPNIFPWEWLRVEVLT